MVTSVDEFNRDDVAGVVVVVVGWAVDTSVAVCVVISAAGEDAWVDGSSAKLDDAPDVVTVGDAVDDFI